MNPQRDARALIDGRSAFNDAVRDMLGQALRARERELCLCDADFEPWPLDDAQLLGTLSAWAALPQRRLVMVASSFDAMPRHFARFTEWRRTWAHVVHGYATDVEPSQIPTLLLSGSLGLTLNDRLHWRGHRLDGDQEVADWREVLDVLLQRSEPGFAANTLGL